MDPSVLMQLAKGAIPPVVFALIVFGGLWLKSKRADATIAATPDSRRNWRHVIAPVVAALLVLMSWPIAFTLSLPPADTFARTPWIWLLVAHFSTPAFFISRRFFGWSAAVVLIAAPFVIPAAQLKLLSVSQLAAQGGLLVLAVTLSTGWIPTIAEKSPRIAVIIQCIALAGASQVLILAFSSLKLGQAAGMLAAIAGAIVIVTIWKNRDIGGKGLDAFLMAASLLMMFSGIHTTDAAMPWLYILLISAAPAAAALLYRAPLKSARTRDLLSLAVCAALVGTALVIAFVNQPVSEY